LEASNDELGGRKFRKRWFETKYNYWQENKVRQQANNTDVKKIESWLAISESRIKQCIRPSVSGGALVAPYVDISSTATLAVRSRQ
jgi:hypothetical protein